MTNDRQVRALLGRKLGMTQMWNADRVVVPVTVLAAAGNVVTDVKTDDAHGYASVQLGFGTIDPRKVTKPMAGHFARAGVPPRRHLVEVRTADAAEYSLGQEVGLDVFAAGDVVDVVGTTKGKGYAGVMKRHGFHGLGAAHGTQRKHRAPGAIGACATPGRVFKGVKMAGRMGGERQTVQNLVLHAVDLERGYLVVRGAVPGPKNGIVVVKSASKAPAKAA